MGIFQRAQIFLVQVVIWCENCALHIARSILFPFRVTLPKHIVVYKVGNIGDIACAIPALIAIRRAYPEAHITLLTSPGARGAVGAKELLSGAWFFGELRVYYADEIDSFSKIKKLAAELKESRPDLFIQLPDDIASFRTLLRNMFFAKAIGARSALGFMVRTIRLFKNAQVDHTFQKTEVESLLDLLRENGIPVREVEFDFPSDPLRRSKVQSELAAKWKDFKHELLVAISPGGKREANRWPKERFREVAEYLARTYHARIVIVGGKDDGALAKEIAKNLSADHVFIGCGKFTLLETVELLRNCAFLITNSTGTIHLAAAVHLPAIGIYGVRDIYGRWFPYGKDNIVLYHRPFDCDYRSEACIKKSIEAITAAEVISACDKLKKRRKQ